MRIPATASSAPAVGAVAAWGAGLVLTALGAGALTPMAAVQEGGAARGAGAVLVLFGTAALAWGVVVLARGRIVAPRLGVAGGLAAVGSAAVMLWLAPVGTSVAAVAAASVLLLVVALICASRVRTRRPREQDTSAGRLSVPAMLAAAVVVAAIVTPALSTTEAARVTPSHGSHGVPENGDHH